ncbi:MAG: DUF4268 domain-containing protein [Pedobacter sp.]
MYSKDEVATLKQEFWTTFGQYMALETSSAGLRVNWVNYKTGIKHLYFKMEADGKKARIGIEMNHTDLSMQSLLFEQFQEFKSMLRDHLDEDWTWELHTTDDYGKAISRISTAVYGLSIFKREDWPALISFLKPRLLALDNFWNDAQDSFGLFT